MEPYNSKSRKSRLVSPGLRTPRQFTPWQWKHDIIADCERGLRKTNIVTADGKPGWFFAMAGGGVGHYGYT